jgi:hypothetical protein
MVAGLDCQGAVQTKSTTVGGTCLLRLERSRSEAAVVASKYNLHSPRSCLSEHQHHFVNDAVSNSAIV